MQKHFGFVCRHKNDRLYHPKVRNETLPIKSLPYSPEGLKKLLQARDESNRIGLIDPSPSRMDIVIHHKVNEGRDRRFALIENNGSITGYALFMFDRLNIFPTQPDMLTSTYEMGVTWGIPEAKRLGKNNVIIRPRDTDTTPLSALKTMGFKKLERSTPRMARSLLEDLPNVTVPPKYQIRPFKGVEDLEAWAKMRLATYGSEQNEENIHNVMADHKNEMAYEGYDPTLEIVAEYHDGSLVAYCGGAFDTAECEATACNDGWTDPVGTAPNHRQKGLARACMVEALYRLKKRGATRALLGTSHQNVAMRSLAQSLGYTTIHHVLTYELSLKK